MTVVVATLLLAAASSIGLRSTSGWLDDWHPMDRLGAALIIGGTLVAVSLEFFLRWDLVDAGLGLAFSLAPVGLYDLTKWWFRARTLSRPWLLRTTAPRWLLAMRWILLVALLAGVTLVALWSQSAATPL